MEYAAASTSHRSVYNGGTRDYTSEFKTTETFKSKEDLVKWAREVGRLHGFVVIILRSDSGEGSKSPRVTLACERSGKCGSISTSEESMSDKRGRRRTVTKKCDCPFRLTGKMLAAGSEWQLMVVEGMHNHETKDTGKRGYSFQGEKSSVTDMYEPGKQPEEILGVDNDSQNFDCVDKWFEDGSSLLLQLMSKAERYYFIEKHRTGPKMDTALDVFLTHRTSLQLLLAFPTVFLIEFTQWARRPPCSWTTLEIFGVASTGTPFFVALAITSRERSSYEWALRSLQGVMNDYGIVMPDIVVLEILGEYPIQLAPMKKAINDVFSTAIVLLSMRSMYNCVETYTREISELNDVEQDSFKKKWKLLVASPTEAEFKQHEMQLRTEFCMFPNILDYVTHSLLKPYKEMFVAAWTDKVMHFGNTAPIFFHLRMNTTPDLVWNDKSSKAKAKAKSYCFIVDYIDTHFGGIVDQTVIDEFWEDLHCFIEYENADIKASLKESLGNKYNDQSGFQELKELHGTISIHALTLKRERTMLASLVYYGDYCGCAIGTTHGLPCAHDIAKFKREGRSIPPECIDSYWWKLDLKPSRKIAEGSAEGRIKRPRPSEETNTNTQSDLALPADSISERNSPIAGFIVPSTQKWQPDDEVESVLFRTEEMLKSHLPGMTQGNKGCAAANLAESPSSTTPTHAPNPNSCMASLNQPTDLEARFRSFVTRFDAKDQLSIAFDNIEKPLSGNMSSFECGKIPSEFLVPLRKFADRYGGGSFSSLFAEGKSTRQKQILIEQFGQLLYSMEVEEVKSEETFLIWRDVCHDVVDWGLKVDFMFDYLKGAAKSFFGHILKPAGSESCCREIQQLKKSVLDMKSELVCLEEKLEKAKDDLNTKFGYFIGPDSMACILESSWTPQSRATHGLY